MEQADPHHSLDLLRAVSADYEVLREISRGGMGVVYLARNRRMDRLEGLKVVKQALLERAGALERFEREMRSAARLNHPNIVTAFSSPPLEGVLAFAMEYVDGVDLHKLVKTNGPLPVSNACYYTWQVAQGLQHAHERRMVHRDIKPNNLMLTRDGKKQLIKILDFGLAKATSENQIDGGLTGEGQILGTPLYMAPEQIVSASRADIRADIYSLGCTLYYLLTGDPPFPRKESLYEILRAHQSDTARPLNELRNDVPAELAAVVARMLAKDPAQRYQQPAEVAQALAPWFKAGVKSMPLPASPAGMSPSPPPPVVAAEQETASVKETKAGQIPDPPFGQPLADGGAPPGVSPAQTMFEIVVEPGDSQMPAHRARARRDQARRRNAGLVLWGGVTAGVLLLGTLLLWAGGAFDTSKPGTKNGKGDQQDPAPTVDANRRKGNRNGRPKKNRVPSPDESDEMAVADSASAGTADPVVANTGVKVTNPPPGTSPDAAKKRPETIIPPVDGTRLLQLFSGPPQIDNTLGMKLVLIPAGEFQMGYEQSPEELARIYPYATKDWFTSAQKRHRVRITQPFYLGVYEVTVGEFRQFVSDRAYETDAEKDRVGGWGYDEKSRKLAGPRTDFSWNNTGFPQTDQNPVVYVSWNDAQAFCRWLSEKEGVSYRLPTEAEWEYACRAGTQTLYQNGNDPQALAAVANAWDESVRKKFFNPAEPLLPGDGYAFTAPVGQYAPNRFGLYDMHGNAAEWCADLFDGDYYRASSIDDPPGPEKGVERVTRGGSWDKTAAQCGSAFRASKRRGDRSLHTGFRVVRAVE